MLACSQENNQENAEENRTATACVVLNYNNAADTIACVESLLGGEQRPSWIILVDNASPDDSVARLRAWAAGQEIPELRDPATGAILAPVTKPLQLEETAPLALLLEPVDQSSASTAGSRLLLLHAQENRGYGSGNNHGIRLALQLGADAVWLLNNDTVVTQTALAAMKRRLFGQDRPGLCGSLTCYYNNPNKVQCRAGGGYNPLTLRSFFNGHNLSLQEALHSPATEVERALRYINGASVLVSREFLKEVGLMYEGFFLYCEELDWAFRAAKATTSKGQRFTLSYAPDALIYHKEGETTGWSQNAFAPRMAIRLAQSRLKLALRQRRWALPFVCLDIGCAVLRILWRKSLRQLSGR